ncbi:phosphoribosylformylglycinamidine synthase [Candidatus Nomurabacteria bacterium RIFOXYC2_FULL_36_8]|nr:MAG: Phosphoribosylformylglycinamidine synthase 2 [Candidatus Nomurabacteria bacterium GW2011_GWE2_36_115]KKP94343.1 MAG: Phosphoribosylformylglycinamidine synthase 2 [Candidatus Nomurabacteria bacterium GW2011_GWF2_36_126]KKP96831.1 MAG: Phosphoribosylformylglycinamidine synthase 2 [Candidatus Nomurabacteria bacterium GW2011_GWD2_36_14]KKP99565.1 MAG: Phosphoribosylformylglycinamidine synthase 2 [Candidatus Nomurabacteria bacterium GW2011_GWF2_36_19]KKQ05561.1 MAG: Phosphoribosylformylglyci
MISRLYVLPKGEDSRTRLFLKSWQGLGLKGRITHLSILDTYIINGELSSGELTKVAESLTNQNFEKFLINELPTSLDLGVKEKNFSQIIEIGFLPGVTDNVAHTAKETIVDLLHIKNDTSLEVFTSKAFLISGSISSEDAKKVSLSLHNPLIEKGYIYDIGEIKKENNLPLKIPKVVLTKQKDFIEVPLSLADEELIKIGKEGILGNDGVRRGPLALDLESMKVIKDYFKTLGRNPKDIELESLAQTWSEHCKHTIFANPIDDINDGLYKTYIKGATNKIRAQKGKDDFCISVFSDNSGGIVFDKDYLVTHKVETHNSPSALDPFGGAITGIVGVNRDTIGFGLGAKPVANMYGFCFGNPYDTRALYKDKNLTQKMLPPKRIMDGVIKGVNVGGNCSGIPTVSGFVKYDDSFRGKPLVFVGTVGIIPRKINGKLSHEKEAQNGDLVVVVGGRVGADGIHGATFSSVAMDSTSPATAVQIGDPITQKKLSDAIVKEARSMDLYTSITDNGAGGISCSIAEMAKECGGVVVDLEKVSLKYPGLQPWQIWISESQERMTLSVPKEKWSTFNKLMDSRGVEASVVGTFTNSGKCIVNYNGKEIMNISLEFLHDGLPKKHLESSPIVHNNSTPKIPKGENRTKVFEELLKDKNIAGFSFIADQYDHEVQASSVLKPLDGRGRINTEAQVFRPVLSSSKGVVVSSGLYPTYSFINTYHMAACSIDTAIRNAICAGASLSGLAILDNFCWCSSYDQNKLYELIEALKACYDYAVGYGTPFISGKDSMFNDFKGYDEFGNPVAISIPPTLLISAIGVMPDIYKTVSPSFKNAGDSIYILGETFNELGGSEYYKMISKKNGDENAIGNDVPKVDFKKNTKIYQALEKAITKELIRSATSLTSGGLAIVLAKASIGGMLGVNISLKNLPGNYSGVDEALFSESQGRILVTVSKEDISKFEKAVKGIAYAKLGTVLKNDKFIILDKNNKKVIDTNLKKLFTIYHEFSNKMR